MNLKQVLNDEILPCVEKPSRYLGSELNAVHKDPSEVEVRLALIFPDLYDLGLGNLGLHILYAVLNGLPGVWAERAYAPAKDLEAVLRERGLPMFANESKDSLAEFDGLGFTLQSELTYTNILNIIELSGIPLRAADRREEDPLIFAGGPAVFNPEPIAPFMDFLVIGDGEDAVVDLAETLKRLKGATRREKLLALSGLEGFYVPSLYPMEQLPDGRILPVEGAPPIRKRTTADLDAATFPTDYIVPYTQQVHDRVSLEVLRGCTQGCRFCQAGMTTRPVRERSLSKLDELMKTALENTGYEEVSLVSLSTCDYSRVQQLVDQTAARAAEGRVSVSLPSLRLDSFSVGLADKVAGERRSGLTFAPEAASPRLRAVINKWIPDEDLLGMASQAYDRGWNHVKLYFMIGLPTERDDDVEAIADLTLRTLKEGRRRNHKARVNLGVSTFVPKPFTPFQWAPQLNIEETNRRQAILDERFRKANGVKFGRHDPGETWLEGLVSRTDRRAGDLIEAAFRNGARFDAWREHLDMAAWRKAIEDTGFDVDDALRERALDERLPWDHIDIHIPKSWFQEDWQRATELKHAPDCRHSQCHRCGVIDVERELCAHMLRNAIDGAKEEGTWQPRRKGQDEERATTAPLGARMVNEERPERVAEPDPVQRLRFRIGRAGDVRFLSHLESMNAWLRALRRASAPLAYSQGFHAHPRVSFSTASPVGEESVGDYMDIMLVRREEPAALLARLQGTLAQGFKALAVCEVPLRGPSLMGRLAGFRFDIFAAGDAAEVAAKAEALMAAAEIPVERKTKKRGRSQRGTKIVDLRPMLVSLEAAPEGEGQVRIRFATNVIGGRSMRWKDALDLLGLDVQLARVLKRETLLTPDEPVPEYAEQRQVEP